MSYYNITVSVDEADSFQKNFLELLKHMSETGNLLSIKPMKTKIFTSDCLFFDDVGSETYNEISKIADIQSKLDLKIESVKELSTYTEEIESIIKAKSEDIITAVKNLMKGASDDDEAEPVTVELPDVPDAYEEPVNSTPSEEEPKDTDEVNSETPEPDEPNDEEDTYTDEPEPDDDDEYEDDLDMDDSNPEENESTEKSVPDGKLYNDEYEELMTDAEFAEKSEAEKQELIMSQVGWEGFTDHSLEEKKNWQTKHFISYSSYLEKYPSMPEIDKPKFWFKSYYNYVYAIELYEENGKNRSGFYTFDSFIRAKLNKDIPCEDVIRNKIENLYK